MAGEILTPGEIARAGSAKELAFMVRRAVISPSLQDFQESQHALGLFSVATKRAVLIDTTLYGLGRTIDPQGTKHEELEVATQQIVRKVRKDPVFGLTRQLLRRNGDAIPTVLEAAEALPEEQLVYPYNYPKFRLKERPYRLVESTFLRLLFIASTEYPLAFDSLIALAYPEPLLSRKNSKWTPEWETEFLLREPIKQKLAAFKSNYKIAEAPIPGETGKKGFYLREVAQVTPVVDSQAAAVEQIDRRQVRVEIHPANEYLQIDEKKIPVKKPENSISQQASDGLIVFRYLLQHTENWITNEDARQVISESIEDNISASRANVARIWLLNTISRWGGQLIETQISNQGLEIRINSAYEIDFQPPIRSFQLFPDSPQSDE